MNYKPLNVLIMFCLPSMAQAQESFEDFPVSPLTGQINSRFYTTYTAPSKEPGIKFITFCTTYKLSYGRPDTTLHYQLFLAPNGAVLGTIWVYIPDQHYLGVSAERPAKMLRAYCRKMTGGGFEMPFITTNFYTDYVFRKGLLEAEIDGIVENSNGFHASPLPKDPQTRAGGWRIDYTYNKRGQLESAMASSPSDSGKRTFYDARSYYRYDKQGRRILSFHLDVKDLYTAPHFDTLAQLPDSFGKILMRPFAKWHWNLTGPGVVEPDNSDDDDDTAIARLSKLQDSLDQKVINSYLRQADCIAIYEFDPKGRSSGRLQFHEDELEVKDTFYYDAAGRCVGWHSIDFGGSGIRSISRMYKEWQSVGDNPSFSDWNFEYGANNRVSKASYKLYRNTTKFRYELKEATELTLEKVYELQYLDNGLLGQIKLTSTEPGKYSPTYTQNFILRYDRY